MNDELLRCPFCGGDGYIKVMPDVYDVSTLHHNVYEPDCNSALCPVFSAQYPTRAEAVAAWNTRTPQQALNEAEWRGMLRAAGILRDPGYKGGTIYGMAAELERIAAQEAADATGE